MITISSHKLLLGINVIQFSISTLASISPADKLAKFICLFALQFTFVHQFSPLQDHVHGHVQLIFARAQLAHASSQFGSDVTSVLLAVQHTQSITGKLDHHQLDDSEPQPLELEPLSSVGFVSIISPHHSNSYQLNKFPESFSFTL
ncbi:MAG: hypothetical protein LBU14_05820 [Candidatus Peribacteria bacterium]|nr:hypothetical protein [Candidatus Peribacteria bacterium]